MKISKRNLIKIIRESLLVEEKFEFDIGLSSDPNSPRIFYREEGGKVDAFVQTPDGEVKHKLANASGKSALDVENPKENERDILGSLRIALEDAKTPEAKSKITKALSFRQTSFCSSEVCEREIQIHNLKWVVYIVRCADSSFYTGVTTDVDRRVREHNFSKRGAKYTRSRRPVVLVAKCFVKNRSQALRLEDHVLSPTRRVEPTETKLFFLFLERNLPLMWQTISEKSWSL